MCVVFAPGAAHMSSTRSPGWGSSSARDHHRRARLRHDRSLLEQLRAVRVELAVQHEALRYVVGGPALDPLAGQLLRDLAGGHEQLVRADGVLGRSVVALEEGDSLLRSERVPPHAHDPLRVRVANRGLGRAVVGELRDQVVRLARGPPHDGVHEPVPAAPVLLRQLHGLADRRVIRHAVEQRHLVDAEPERVQERQVDRAHGARRERHDHVVERAPVLDRAVREPLRECAVARVEAGAIRLGPESAVGVGVLAERALEYPERDLARGRRLLPARASASVHELDHQARLPAWPRSHAPDSIARPPGGFTSSSSSAPPAQPNSSRPSSP